LGSCRQVHKEEGETGAIHYSLPARGAAAGFPTGGIIDGCRRPTLITTLALRAALAGALVLGLLGGCGIFKPNEETLAIVNARALGMPVGEFFDRYGRPEQRRELADSTLQFVWVSARGSPTGAEGVDDHVCSLRLAADQRGRISGVQLMYDGQGKTRLSRCAEIFAATTP
jgi:hypothetical protein